MGSQPHETYLSVVNSYMYTETSSPIHKTGNEPSGITCSNNINTHTSDHLKYETLLNQVVQESMITSSWWEPFCAGSPHSGCRRLQVAFRPSSRAHSPASCTLRLHYLVALAMLESLDSVRKVVLQESVPVVTIMEHPPIPNHVSSPICHMGECLHLIG